MPDPMPNDDEIIELTLDDLAGEAEAENAPPARPTASPPRRPQPNDPPDGIDLAEPDVEPAQAIRAIVQPRAEQYRWQRPTNKDGTGATHVKTFTAKLRADSLAHLDEQINQWLDEHPEYEVKFVNTHIGPLKGKETEDALIVNVWV